MCMQRMQEAQWANQAQHAVETSGSSATKCRKVEAGAKSKARLPRPAVPALPPTRLRQLLSDCAALHQLIQEGNQGLGLPHALRANRREARVCMWQHRRCNNACMPAQTCCLGACCCSNPPPPTCASAALSSSTSSADLPAGLPLQRQASTQTYAVNLAVSGAWVDAWLE